MNFFETILMIIKIGFRNIVRQKKRSALIISSAATGVIGIIFTIALINAFFIAMVENGIKSGLGHVQIRPAGYEESRKMGMLLQDPLSIQINIEDHKIKNTHFSGRFEREGILRIASFTRGVLFIGIEENEKKVSHYSDWTNEGEFLFPEKTGLHPGTVPCMIGRINAEKMEVAPGDWAVLSLSDQTGTYRSVRCIISGIFSSSVEPIDKYTVILTRRDLSEFYSEKDDLYSYFVFLGESLEHAEKIKGSLQNTFSGNSEIEILSFSDLEKYFSGTMEMVDVFSWIFYLILLIGVALILFESITMSVFERMRELGIMHAIGSRPLFIFAMVIYESILLTIIGSFLGIALGGFLILFFNIYGLNLSYFSEGIESIGKLGSTVYPFLTPLNILEALYFPFLISIASAIFPALKAVRISPVKAIYNR
ncbi:MAG: FtsX-like permease family protein [Spirochaetia bacterium]|nr:FtsX-like permease family protein [Spirochaetia bacterium]